MEIILIAHRRAVVEQSDQLYLRDARDVPERGPVVWKILWDTGDAQVVKPSKAHELEKAFQAIPEKDRWEHETSE